ncbi:nitrilase-related carbon-nitrogen hydrolase [Acinetobacter larvae]|uniref:CN hydrolase domain-containing protein n=1 Tax=Acinetobacter larvae TaxID=1789224 RepID=A0A1B2LXQ2_9GAMM|nr:nitrilase-related carbon-nitrogen hydrolase [Acinetobacter larvae]AOA57710.1 hypothetical protein BFG52_04625 [Acinetobacter larvae]
MKIAMLQAQSTAFDYDKNLEKLIHYAQKAQQQGAQLLITPEMYLSGYVLGAQTQNIAKQFPLQTLQSIAQDLHIALIVGGPRYVATATPPHVFNSAYFIDHNGQLLCCYDKTHLFGALDRQQFQPGQHAVVIQRYRGLNIALLICYDVEFPETVRAAAQAGADLIAVPTAQMQPYDIVNDSVIASRAWESQIYIAYVNQIGQEGYYHYVGKSTCASPTGQILVQASVEQEQLLFADIDHNTVRHGRQENPYLQDLRQDLFANNTH